MKQPPKKNIVYNGHAMTVYGIGWLAYLTHRKTHTVRSWERKKILPRPILDLKDGRRWYTTAELIAYVRIFNRCVFKPMVPVVRNGFREQAYDFSNKLRRMVAKTPSEFGTKIKDSDRMEQAIEAYKEKVWQDKADKLLQA